MRLVDSHGHVNADRFADDVELVLGAARLAGVERILVPGWNRASSERALALVDRFAWLDAAVGVHPHDAAKATDADWAAIEGWARDERVVAIGETGPRLGPDVLALGRPAREPAPEPRPRRSRRASPRSSTAGRRPANATRRTRCSTSCGRAGFGGAASRAGASGTGRRPSSTASRGRSTTRATSSALGLAVSFSGLVFRGGEEASAEVAALVPGERLLVETDAPFLTPPGAPRSRNEPAFVALTARWVAERRGVRGGGLDAFGDGLVAAYDATFRRRRPADAESEHVDFG